MKRSLPKHAQIFVPTPIALLNFNFAKHPFSLHFKYFLKYIFSIDFIIIFMIFVHISAIIYSFHDYFATWSKYFATWDLFRGSGALPKTEITTIISITEQYQFLE